MSATSGVVSVGDQDEVAEVSDPLPPATVHGETCHSTGITRRLPRRSNRLKIGLKRTGKVSSISKLAAQNITVSSSSPPSGGSSVDSAPSARLGAVPDARERAPQVDATRTMIPPPGIFCAEVPVAHRPLLLSQYPKQLSQPNMRPLKDPMAEDHTSEVQELRSEIARLKHQLSATSSYCGNTPQVTGGRPLHAYMDKKPLDVFRLPIVGPWKGPYGRMTYEHFRRQFMGQVSLYQLRGMDGIYYLQRCVEGSVADDIRQFALEGYSDVSQVIEIMDKKYRSAWKIEAMENRWDGPSMNQGQSESVGDYITRLEQEAASLYSATGRVVDETTIRSRFRRGLLPALRSTVAQHLGPRVPPLGELVEIALYFSNSFRDSSRKDQRGGQAVCRDFQRGNCRRGAACRFRHSLQQQPDPSPDSTKQSTSTTANTSSTDKASYCFEFRRTGQCSRPSCTFAHDRVDQKQQSHSTAAIHASHLEISDDNGELWIGTTEDQYSSTCAIDVAQCNGVTRAVTEVLSVGHPASPVRPRIEVRCLLDTGSTINLCSLAMLKRYGCNMPCEASKAPVRHTVRLADGVQQLQLLGTVPLSLRTKDGCEVVQDFWVASQLSYDAILGVQALGALGVHICYSRGVLTPSISSGNGDTTYGHVPNHATSTLCQDSAVTTQPMDPASQEFHDGLMPCIENVEPPSVVAHMREVSLEGDKKFVFRSPMPLRRVVAGSEPHPPCPPDKRAETFMELTDLPWRDHTRPRLNLGEAKGRARSLENSMSFRQNCQVQQALYDLIENGKLVSCDATSPAIKYFLPARVVFKESSSTSPVRITVDGRRINRFLSNGSEDDADSLIYNLTVFRLARCYRNLDLTTAFHAVRLSPTASSFCGLYMYGGAYVWTVLAFGLAPSPSILYQSVKPHLFSAFPCPRRFLSLYVDDIAVMAETLATVEAREADVIRVLASGDFHTQPKKRVCSATSAGTHAHLGYEWCLEGDGVDRQDEVRCRVPEEILKVSAMAPITKRQLLSLYSKFHDPLGLFTPVSVRARMNMHEIYGSQVGWDELVRPSDMQNFLDWRQALSSLNLTIPRAIDNSEIFVFCDSSGTGWGSVALGAAVDISDLSTEAVAPNSTAPLFPLRGTGGIYGASSSAAWSTPKKELYAVFRGCQLLEEIMNAAANLEPDRERRWVIITDSAISVFRLKSADSKLKMSDLERRWVTYIRATCARFNWRVTHVRSELNVADIPSRGVIGQTHRLLGSVTLSEARVMVGSSSLVEFSPVVGDNTGRLALDKDCPKSGEDIAATGYPPDLAQCFAIGQDNVVDDGPTPLGTSQYQMEALRDHQQKSLLCKEISHYLAQVKGGAQSDDFKSSIPKSFLSREAPLYALQDGVLYRVSAVDTDGTVIRKAVLTKNDIPYVHTIIDRSHERMGHLGAAKLHTILSKHYYLPYFLSIIKRRLKSCDACQRVHAARCNWRVFGRLKFKSTAPGQVYGVDFMSMPSGKPTFGSTAPFTALLTVTCATTSFTFLRPVRTLSIAECTAVLESVFSDCGWPVALVFDGMANSCPWMSSRQSQSLKAWCFNHNVAAVVLPPYGGSYAGWIERPHLAIRSMWKASVASGCDEDSWPSMVPNFQLAYNGSPYSTDSPLSPLHLFFTSPGRLPCDLSSPEDDKVLLQGVSQLMLPSEQAFLRDLHSKTAENFRLDWTQYRDHWIKIKEHQQSAYQRRMGSDAHRPTIKVGDLVLVYVPSGSKMSLPNFCGPYRVTEHVSPSLCRIDSANMGGHSSLKDISPLQLYGNCVRYIPREPDPHVQDWICCTRCRAWHKADAIMCARFRRSNAVFTCRTIGARCLPVRQRPSTVGGDD